jgi:TPR repeat protein
MAKQKKILKVTEFIQAAEQGNVLAQLKLGDIYYSGKGAPKNFESAAFWYEKAAENGNQEAKFKIAAMYENGQGVSKDYAKAAFWFGKAVSHEDLNDKPNYSYKDKTARRGTVNQNEMSVKPTNPEVEKTAEEIDYSQLGMMNFKGIRVRKEHKKAIDNFKKGANKGDPRCKNQLGLLYELDPNVEKKYTKALKLYTEAAEAGFVDAKFNLSMLYLYGRGVPQDFGLSFEL